MLVYTRVFYTLISVVTYLLFGSHLRIQSLLQCGSFESPMVETFSGSLLWELVHVELKLRTPST
jgi:hypothetical protein